MSDLWTLLNSNFPNEVAIYRSLQAALSSLEDGKLTFPKKEITIPAIQPLKALFSSTDQYTDQNRVMELTELVSKMDALHGIVSNTSQMTFNAWWKLEKLQYNVNLMEFFTQDFTRIYLQSINSGHCDDPLERQRRCNLLMDVLIDRL